MKKVLLSALCLLLFSAIKAQTFTHGHLTVVLSDSMRHDSTVCTTMYYTYGMATVDSSYTGEILNFVDTSTGTLRASYINTTGVSPWSVPILASSSVYNGHGLYDNEIWGGYVRFTREILKTDCGVDTVFLTGGDSLAVTNPCIYSTVSGRIYADNNNNCTFDGGDTGLYQVPEYTAAAFVPGHPFTVDSSSWNTSYLDGTYSVDFQQSWLTSCSVYLPSYYSFIFPASSCFTGAPYTFTSLPQTNVDFPLQCTSNIDLQCNAMSAGRIRFTRAFTIQPYVSNMGCARVSGDLMFVKDSRAIYDPSLSGHPADSVRGDTLIWNYANLSSIVSGAAYWNSFIGDIYLSLAPGVAVGDTLCFRVYTNIPAADVNPANNDYSFCMPVVYSFDPNEKEVSPQGYSAAGYIPAGTDTLTYAIHFQNTGSDVAENITVIDTLDSHINAASLRILGTSHQMTPKWLTAHILEFDYDEINLPDSSANEPASHGEVRFSVALNASLPYGTQIKNTGYIYFDLNPAVVTNTTLNTIETPSYIKPLTTTTNVKVYPNPATDVVTIENLANGDISIMNLGGQVVISRHIANDKGTIDVSQLASGVYIMKTVNESNNATIKFTKY